MPVYKNTSNGMLNVYFKNTQGLQENLKLKPNQEVLLKFFLQDKYIPDGLEMVSQYPFNNILLTENQNSYNFTMNQNTYYYRIEPYGGQVSMYYETYYEELVQSESDYTYINGMFIPIEGDVDNPLYDGDSPYEELQLESTQSSLLSSSESIDTKMDTLNTLQTESTVSQIDSKLTDGSQKQNVVVNELPSDTTNYTITSQPQSQTQTVDNTTPLLLEIQTPGQDNRRVLIVTNNSIQSYMRIGGSDIQPNKGIIIPPKDSIQLSFDKTNYVQIYQIQDSSDVSISYTEIY